MNTVYSVRNFKTFGEKEAVVPFAPITFLTGANCSGKSSIVKSLVLFEKYLNNVIEEAKKNNSFLPFEHYPNFTDSVLKLGGFSSVYNSSSPKGNPISCSYRIHSAFLNRTFIVQYDFVSNPYDELDNGILGSLMIKDADGNVIFRWTLDKDHDMNFNVLDYVNLSLLKQSFVEFTAWKLNSKMKLEKPDWIAQDNDIIRKVIKKTVSSVEDGTYKINKNNKLSSLTESINRLRLAETSQLISILMGDTIFPMPVLEMTRKVPKSRVRSFLTSKLEEAGIDPKDSQDIIAVLEDFEKSRYGTLAEYFADWEKENILLRKNLESSDNSKDLYASLINVLSLTSRYGKTQNRHIYNAMVKISCILDKEFDRSVSAQIAQNRCLHDHYELFLHFVRIFIYEVLMPPFVSNIKYLGTSKIEAKRLYFLEDRSNDFGELFWQYFNLKKKWKTSAVHENTDYSPGDFINKWIKRFEIGDSLEIKSSMSGQGIAVYVDDRMLADEGYGATQILAVLLNIEVAILNIILNEDQQNLQDDYQITLVLEEPEVHLHPKFQSLLADMFHDAYAEYGIHFIVETHSEYMIRKSQVLVAQMNFSSHDEAEDKCGFRTIYVPKGGRPYSLCYRSDGKFSEDFGAGFFDESSNLVFEIL